MRIEGMIGTPGMPLVGPATPGTGRTETFQHLLLDSIAQVNGLQGEAERIVERVGAGEEINPAVVADASPRADILKIVCVTLLTSRGPSTFISTTAERSAIDIFTIWRSVPRSISTVYL